MNYKDWLQIMRLGLISPISNFFVQPEVENWNVNLLETLWKDRVSKALPSNIHFCIDSRKLNAGDIFIAIKGAKSNGHHYVDEAFQKGASFAIVNELQPFSGNCIFVKNTVTFLQQMACLWWKNVNPYSIGITGSNGKTTTKEWVKDILSQFYPLSKIFFNPGNQNTEIGLPLAILNGLESTHEYAVVEMGLSQAGDLQKLASWFPLNCSVLLNVGSAHIGNFKDQTHLFAAKKEIIDQADASSEIVLYWNDERIRSILSSREEFLPVSGSTEARCTFFGEGIPDSEQNPYVSLDSYHVQTRNGQPVTQLQLKISQGSGVRTPAHTLHIDLPLFLHKGFALDLCAAVAICSKILPSEKLKEFYPDLLSLPKERFEIHSIKGNWLIFDQYNASIESLSVALDLLLEMKNIGFIKAFCPVVGSILETGEHSEAIHAKIWEKLFDSEPERIYVFSKDHQIKKALEDQSGYSSTEIVETDDAQELAARIWIDLTETQQRVFYFKASRMVRLEEVIESVMGFFDRGCFNDFTLQIQHSSV